MALFKVNTGLREMEVSKLQWSWEIRVPDLRTSVFVIPASAVKNRMDRVVVMNDAAREALEAVRG